METEQRPGNGSKKKSQGKLEEILRQMKMKTERTQTSRLQQARRKEDTVQPQMLRLTKKSPQQSPNLYLKEVEREE